ncbi:hypothetical protein [Pigmentiphaga humi]|uniref:hypothetical protein n=1 Tax=Pigmentiphaga humi TaxID=2478468 RepID=UPI000F520992|nr:hypothetical protein [Pigmentiphaga humi]
MESSFDWKGVAASAIAGGVAYQVGTSSIGKLEHLGDIAQESVPTFAEIGTPWGPALQSSAPEALAARFSVENGATLYRLVTLGKSEAAEAQFWTLDTR